MTVTISPDELRALGGRIVVPFAALRHDNHRLIPARGRLIASSQYRKAKDALRARLRAVTPPIPLRTGWVAVCCVFYWPDRRKRDVANYTKMLHDALTGIAYEDDVQIADARQRRGGVDRQNPRVEITITEVAA